MAAVRRTPGQSFGTEVLNRERPAETWRVLKARHTALFQEHGRVFVKAMTLCSPSPDKSRLRDEITEQIAALTAEDKETQSELLFQKLVSHPRYASARRVALYLSTPAEADTARLVRDAWARGKHVFLPQYAGGHMHMIKMVADRDRGTHLDDKADALLTGGLDLIVTPGVAFSRGGARLGHGGGYYDRFLARARALPLGRPHVLALAFSCQLLPDGAVPTTRTDEPVDEVLTAH